ncbi:cyclin-D1-1 [Arachis duranensis]|uniref:B-like cyclin n=1 Tax=Arachis duranensis TaxID=130453 RepID=A0A6P4DDF1_ARADU|nr:cyclin-D1-1 [Arachis duranensis]XP_025699369.1 cyclin-D1-1 [Arachis hypogaea]XP_057763141.1 cyclin-D1-1-like [Arachis stenosperma]
MSISCSDFFSDSDLFCAEDTSGILSEESPESSSSFSDFDSLSPPLPPMEEEESIAGFLEDEQNFVPGFEYLTRFQSHSLDASAREESVAWILKVQAYYGFQPLTAYLSVNYMDRFLNSRQLPQTNGWPLQLLSIACLSLAAKMEEPLVPSLLDLQVEGAKYIFEPRTIQRMELLVLGVLDWRLRSVTPFSFLGFFACKLDSTGTFTRFLISRATQIILSNIQEASFLAYWPSCIAATAILCAANEIPNWSLVKPEHAESWCQGLRKEKIRGCYQLMQELLVIDNNQRKTPKVLPQLRVMTTRPLTRSSVSSFLSSSSLSSSTSSSAFSLSYKRRKLNNCFWVDDHKGNAP